MVYIVNMEWTEKELLNIRERVMRRVYFTWFVRTAVLPFGILAAAVLVALRELPNFNFAIILENTLKRLSDLDLLGLTRYLAMALQNTEIVSAFLFTAAFGLLVFSSRRIFQNLSFFFVKS